MVLVAGGSLVQNGVDAAPREGAGALAVGLRAVLVVKGSRAQNGGVVVAQEGAGALVAG